MKKKIDDNFIMLPTEDFCFKELMQNVKVRQGVIAALLAVKPETVEGTELLLTILPQEYEDDKQGILDFIHFPDNEKCYRTISFYDVETGVLYSDLMEIQILELKKLQKDVPEDTGMNASNNATVYDWMRFFCGKSRKEFENMAQTDEYIGEACEELKKLSADERKRLEYEAREKALRDYNSQVKSYYDRGHAAGHEEGLVKGHIEGLAEGLAKGRAEGQEEGRSEGRIEGRTEGISRINSLYGKLVDLGRMDDIARAAKEIAYLEELFLEFGL